ncbi:MAG: aminoglycoside phosphotransferase family protein [Acidobacteriota bacterium]|nr:aminoglycoside phosphotransferase family protein [Acidobacteriota bacterium]
MKRAVSADLPQKFIEGIRSAFGAEGARWLERLPEITGEIEREWSLRIEKPFPNLSYHFVAPCVFKTGGEAVVKIGFPGERATTFREVRMLEFMDGDGICRLLRFDEKRLALLLEKVTPGENLKEVCGGSGGDARAVEIAIKVLRAFRREPPENIEFPAMEKWFDVLKKAGKTGFAPEYVKKARRFFDELSAASERKTLLHGDFHHENILSAERAPFLAIDPKGIIGDIGYDLSVFMVNHARWLESAPDLSEKLDDAIRAFSEAFEIESQNLRKWIFAQSILSAWWTFEENSENWKNELAFTEIWKV